MPSNQPISITKKKKNVQNTVSSACALIPLQLVDAYPQLPQMVMAEVTVYFGGTRSYHVAQAGLEPRDLPLSSKCWAQRPEPPFLVLAVT